MPVADQGPPLAELPLAQYRPYSRLRLARTTVARAREPAVDAHTHLGRWLTAGAWAAPDVAALIALMDSCNIAAIVNLDGRWGDELADQLVYCSSGVVGASCMHQHSRAAVAGTPGCLMADATLGRAGDQDGLTV